MKKTAAVCSALALLLPVVALAGPIADIDGVYVEARSAQVFIGGCIWNSEAVTIGREAVMAWRIDHGVIDGVPVDGLAVVAAVAGDANLAMNPDAGRQTVLFVDERATAAQRSALETAYIRRNAAVFGDVVDVVAAPITFEDIEEGYRVRAGADLQLEATTLHIDHKRLERCGDAQWYEPFFSLEESTLGLAVSHSYQGTALGTRWSDPGKQSVFFGRFRF